MIPQIYIEIILILGFYSFVLILSGIVHEKCHQESLKISKIKYKAYLFKTDIYNWELIPKKDKIHMYLMGIMGGTISVLFLSIVTGTYYAIIFYLFACHSDLKGISDIYKKTK